MFICANLTLPSLIITVFLGIITVIHFWSKRHYYYYGFKIPGPSSSFLGSAISFIFEKRDNLESVINLIKPDPEVFKFWLGPHFQIVTSRPQDVEMVLNYCLEKGSVYKYFNEQAQNSLIAAPAAVWKKNRKLINHSFSAKMVNSFHNSFVQHSKNVVKVLDSVCGREESDLIMKLWNCTLKSAADTLFDAEPEAYTDFLHKMIPWIVRTQQIMVKRISSFWLHLDFIWKRSALGKELKKIADEATECVQSVIDYKIRSDRKKMENDSKAEYFFLNLLMKSQMSREQMAQEIALMITAGTETTVVALTCFILVLGLYTKIQDKVYKEVESIIDNKSEPTLEDINKMEYLERVIKETMRLMPVAPLVIRSVDKNVHSEPYVFPAGSDIYIPIIHIHRDPDLWPHPLKFDPDRFLPQNIEKRHKCAYIPFSFGTRNCIGFKYAMLQMKCVAANIVKNFKIKTLKYKSLHDIEYEFHLIRKPKNYSVLLEKRLK